MTFSTDFMLDNASLAPNSGNRIVLSWSDVLAGYENGLLGWRTPIKFAEELAALGSADLATNELAAVDKDDDWKVRDILQELALRQVADQALCNRKWLYLSMLWLYEHFSEVDRPFLQLQSIQDDFGFPAETSAFLRLDEPDGEQREAVLAKWKEYLTAARSELSSEKP
jgi:hypothetical protein